jgi:Secretion system C-terminal sorting domain
MKQLLLYPFLFITIVVQAQNKNILTSLFWIKTENQNFSKAKPEVALPEQKIKKLYNFNPIVDFSKSNFSKKTKNIIKNQSSLFLVYKATTNEENNLLLIQKGSFKTFVTSKKIIADKEIILNKGDATKGFILSYFNNNNSILSKKSGSITFDDLLYEDKEGKSQLMELIYIPNLLSGYEKNLIESYLSIKYGISLIEKDYYSYNGKKIWDFKKNEAFKYRVTGLGKDTLDGLNQKQSGNSEKDGICIGHNKIEKSNDENKVAVSNNSFLLWGDNNLDNHIDQNKKESSLKKMKRVWKIQTTAEDESLTNPLQIVINKKEMFKEAKKDEALATEQEYWLAIDSSSSNTKDFNFINAKYIKASVNNEENLIFDQIIFKNNTTALFTFVQAPTFFVTYDVLSTNCNIDSNGNLKLKIVGGTAPYKIQIQSKNQVKYFTTNNDFFELKDIVTGDYNLQVSDNKNSQKNDFSIGESKNDILSINSEYFLESNKDLTIAPTTNNQDNISEYEWSLNDKLLSSENKITVNQTGNYKLAIVTKLGCKKEFPFEVKTKEINNFDGWMVFPNPIKPSENFTIKFNLKEQSNVNVTLSDLNGKVIKKTNLGRIKEYELQENILISGSYLLTVSKNGKQETTKLIINY